MKNKNLGAILICSLTSLGLAGCSSSDNNTPSQQQVTIETETPEEVSKVTIRILDTSGNALTNIPVTFDDNDTGLLARFAGKSANTLASKGLANKITTAQSDELGFVTVELEKGTTTGDLSISIDQAGFFPVTQIYEIGDGNTVEVLKLTTKPADGETLGVTAENEAGETIEVISMTANQAFEAPQTISVVDSLGTSVDIEASVTKIETKSIDSVTSAKKVVAEVAIPSTVVSKTADGKAAVGDLKISAAVYQNNSAAAVTGFPGGLVIGSNLTNAQEAPETPVTTTSNSDDTTGFITAGFVALDVTDEGGNDITNFEGSTGVDLDGDGELEDGLLVTTLVPKATVNPGTGQTVALGDTIPVWSFNDKDAQWTFDGQAKIFDEADASNWKAHFAAKHLSYWNLDFNVRYCRNKSIDSNALIEFKIAPNGSRDNRMLIVNTFLSSGGYYATRTVNMDGFVKGYLPSQNVKLVVIDASTFSQVNIESINGNPYNAATGFDFCEIVRSTYDNDRILRGNDIVLAQPVQPLVEMDVEVETSCADESLDAIEPPEGIPSTNVYLYAADNVSLLSTNITDASGRLTLTGLSPNVAYNLHVENRLVPSDPKQKRFISSVAEAATPEVFDFERGCSVTTTTGSNGGS